MAWSDYPHENWLYSSALARNGTDNSEMRPYEELANAIIISACTDYVKHYGASEGHNDTCEGVVNFIRSESFSLLTDLDPEGLIKALQEIGQERSRHSTRVFIKRG